MTLKAKLSKDKVSRIINLSKKNKIVLAVLGILALFVIGYTINSHIQATNIRVENSRNELKGNLDELLSLRNNPFILATEVEETEDIATNALVVISGRDVRLHKDKSERINEVLFGIRFNINALEYAYGQLNTLLEDAKELKLEEHISVEETKELSELIATYTDIKENNGFHKFTDSIIDLGERLSEIRGNVSERTLRQGVIDEANNRITQAQVLMEDSYISPEHLLKLENLVNRLLDRIGNFEGNTPAYVSDLSESLYQTISNVSRDTDFRREQSQEYLNGTDNDEVSVGRIIPIGERIQITGKILNLNPRGILNNRFYPSYIWQYVDLWNLRYHNSTISRPHNPRTLSAGLNRHLLDPGGRIQDVINNQYDEFSHKDMRIRVLTEEGEYFVRLPESLHQNILSENNRLFNGWQDFTFIGTKSRPVAHGYRGFRGMPVIRVTNRSDIIVNP